MDKTMQDAINEVVTGCLSNKESLQVAIRKAFECLPAGSTWRERSKAQKLVQERYKAFERAVAVSGSSDATLPQRAAVRSVVRAGGLDPDDTEAIQRREEDLVFDRL